MGFVSRWVCYGIYGMAARSNVLSSMKGVFFGWGTNTHTKRCDILSFEHGISWKSMELHDVWGCMKPMRQTWNATWESGRSVRGWAIARCRPSRPNSDCTEPQTLWILRVSIPRHLQLLALIHEIKRYYIYVILCYYVYLLLLSVLLQYIYIYI